MKSFLFLSLFISLTISGLNAQIGRLPLSPLQKTELKIGVTDIAMVFSRPSIRGRKVFGDLVPFNTLWRTGANRNTTIEFSEDVMIDDKRLAKGKYAIFSKPSPENWEIIFYSDTDNWDVPEILDSTKIVGKIDVKTIQLNKRLEVLDISIGDFTNYKFDLNIAWENTAVTVPIVLTTRKLMDDKIANRLNGPKYGDYYLAAVYQMESGKDYEKGLDWINKAIAITEENGWWNLRVKAILLLELNRKEEAKKIAEQGLESAIADERESAIIELKRILIEIGR